MKRRYTSNVKEYPREYTSWQSAIQRCTNPNKHGYKNYGGRGISVCDRWREPHLGFRNFLEDMGPRPDGCTLDRIDTNGNYCPENCRWSDRSTQTFTQRPRNHSTEVIGVCKFKKGTRIIFKGQIWKNHKLYQKEFKTFADAVAWRKDKELELYGMEALTL